MKPREEGGEVDQQARTIAIEGLLSSRLLLRTDEVATSLGVSPATVRRMIADGTLPSVVINRGSRRVPVEALIAWVRAQSGEGC